MNKKLHIVPSDGEWAIREEGSEDMLALHPTQQAAIEEAVDVAHDHEVDVVVHRRDGSFRNVINLETIERRAVAAADRQSGEGGLHMDGKTLAWGLFAAGAVTALAVYLALNPPVEARRLMHQLDENRPDWMRWD